MTYTDLGEPIPTEGMPDVPPLQIVNIRQLAERNGLNESIFMVDALSRTRRGLVKMILGASPFSCEITRAAVLQYPGGGFVATDPVTLPGNLVDVIHSIMLEQREVP